MHTYASIFFHSSSQFEARAVRSVDKEARQLRLALADAARLSLLESPKGFRVPLGSRV